MNERICQVCEKQLEVGCRNEFGGGGIIPDTRDGLRVFRTCPNMRKHNFIRYLEQFQESSSVTFDLKLTDPNVTHIRESELYANDESEDLTSCNIFFRQTVLHTFRRHFKWVVAYKYRLGQDFSVRVVDDRELVDVFVGNHDYKAHARNKDPYRVCNSIEELILPADLAIIILGKITYKNVAAASVLLEALQTRQFKNKPTWLIEQEGRPFTVFRREDYGTSGIPSCDQTVLNFVEKYYREVTLESTEEDQQADQQAATEELGYEVDEDGNIDVFTSEDEADDLDETEVRKEEEEEEDFDARLANDPNMQSVFGSGEAKKKSSWKGKRR